jgi:hypothetical protein
MAVSQIAGAVEHAGNTILPGVHRFTDEKTLVDVVDDLIMMAVVVISTYSIYERCSVAKAPRVLAPLASTVTVDATDTPSTDDSENTFMVVTSPQL